MHLGQGLHGWVSGRPSGKKAIYPGENQNFRPFGPGGGVPGSSLLLGWAGVALAGNTDALLIPLRSAMSDSDVLAIASVYAESDQSDAPMEKYQPAKGK